MNNKELLSLYRRRLLTGLVHEPFLDIGEVPPGTFVAAVGADNPAKGEIGPTLMGAATVVVDVLKRAVFMRDLNHAIKAGTMTEEGVHAELGSLKCGLGGLRQL
jgi:ornithine cyclodeaminase/alanine dehydrogenase-like protein (mu-crystallin family)